MHDLEIQGVESLVSSLDRVTAEGTVDEIAHGVEEALAALLAEGAIDLPAQFRRPGPDTYARRLVHRSDRHGYTVVAMTWGTGQGTPLHDHAGLWCVEGVWQGEIEVVQYELLEEADERCRFARRTAVTAGRGSTGALIPPFEYHTIANADARDSSVTLHVYGGEMDSCSIFEPVGEDWYLRRVKSMSYDN